jgi:hypothetical protein
MDIADIRAQLERELTWRKDEMRLLHNQLEFIRKDEDKKSYRKSLVVMLYSHYEGFCKRAFLIYINAINKERFKCSEMNDYIVTACFADIFTALDISNAKCKIFKPKLPDDTKLHKFCRQVNFISEMDNFLSKEANIPEDVIDTESNLKREVMRKILFRLGFPYDAFKKHEDKIKDLLEARNEIAHGTFINGIEEDVYKKFERFTYEIMSELMDLLMQALINKAYLRSPVAAVRSS